MLMMGGRTTATEEKPETCRPIDDVSFVLVMVEQRKEGSGGDSEEGRVVVVVGDRVERSMGRTAPTTAAAVDQF